MREKTIITALIGALLLGSTACGGRLYKVAPLPANAAPDVVTNNGNSLNAGAMALDGEQSYERFEANLPLAGVIAVDVRMINGSNAAIKMESLKFQLRDRAGTALKHLPPKKALRMVMKYYENSFYAKAAYRRTLEDYESVALKQVGALEPKGELRGLIFFQTRRETTSVNGLTLSIAGLAAPVTLPLPTGREAARTGGLR
jgi:hypothetical protein